jgi:hypothetical protein
MRWSDIPFQPSSRTLRQFAGLWIAFFAGFAAWEWFRHERAIVAIVLLVLALTVGPLGLVKPRAIRPIFVGWMCLAFPIGWVVSHVLLACAFYGLFTPIALFFRLIGRDALARRHRPEGETYWTPKPAARDVRSYFRQS